MENQFKYQVQSSRDQGIPLDYPNGFFSRFSLTLPAVVEKVLQGGLGGLFFFLFALSLFIAQLVFYWTQTDISSEYLLGGFLPLADARAYLEGALSLSQLGELTQWAGRRPLNHLFFSSLMFLSDFNLYLLFPLLGIFMSALVGLNSYLVARKFGGIAGIYFTLACFLFMKPYWGSFLSESFGFSFGLIGLLFLQYAFEKRFHFFFPLAIGFFSLALAGRSGSYPVVLALLFVPFLLSISIKAKLSGFFAALVLMMMAGNINNVIRSHFGIEGSSFSNLNFTLYGVARGGRGWTQFSEDFPPTKNETTATRDDRLKKELIVSLKNEPILFFKGLYKGMAIYLFRHLKFLPMPLFFFEYMFLSLGLFIVFRKFKSGDLFKDPLLLAIFFSFLGNLIVSPILAQDGGQRVFAATILFNILLACIGIGGLNRNAIASFANSTKLIWAQKVSFCLAGFALVLIFLPISGVFSGNEISFQDAPALCSLNERPLVFKPVKGSILRVQDHISNRPFFVAHEIINKETMMGNASELKFLTNDTKDFQLLSLFDLKERHQLIVKTRNAPEILSSSVHQICLYENDPYNGYWVN